MNTRDYLATAQDKCPDKQSCILTLFCLCDEKKVGFDMSNLPEFADDAEAIDNDWKEARPYFNTSVGAVTFVQKQ